MEEISQLLDVEPGRERGWSYGHIDYCTGIIAEKYPGCQDTVIPDYCDKEEWIEVSPRFSPPTVGPLKEKSPESVKKRKRKDPRELDELPESKRMRTMDQSMGSFRIGDKVKYVIQPGGSTHFAIVRTITERKMVVQFFKPTVHSSGGGTKIVSCNFEKLMDLHDYPHTGHFMWLPTRKCFGARAANYSTRTIYHYDGGIIEIESNDDKQ